MTSAVSVTAAGIVGSGQRKEDLVDVGCWALTAGHSGIISAVTAVIAWEGLSHS
jgi:hypothetical protein